MFLGKGDRRWYAKDLNKLVLENCKVGISFLEGVGT